MAKDDLAPSQKGDPPWDALSAYRVNAMMDAARAFKRGKLGLSAGVMEPERLPGATLVLVQNDTLSNLDEYSVLKVTGHDPLLVPLNWQLAPLLFGNTPDADTNLIVILHESIPAGTSDVKAIGKGVIQGTAIVNVDVTDLAHKWAKPINGNRSRLVSSSAIGPARIASAVGSTGVQKCVVILGDGQGTSTFSPEITIVTATGEEDQLVDPNSDSLITPTLGAGTFMVTAVITGEMQMTSPSAPDPDWGDGTLYATLWDPLNDVPIGEDLGSPTGIVVHAQTSGLFVPGSLTLHCVEIATGNWKVGVRFGFYPENFGGTVYDYIRAHVANLPGPINNPSQITVIKLG